MAFVFLFVFAGALAMAPAAVAKSKGYGFWGWYWGAFFTFVFTFLLNALIGILAVVLVLFGSVAVRDRPEDARATPYFGLHRPPEPPLRPAPQPQRLPEKRPGSKGGKPKGKRQVCTTCSNMIGVGQWAYCPLCGSRELAYK